MSKRVAEKRNQAGWVEGMKYEKRNEAAGGKLNEMCCFEQNARTLRMYRTLVGRTTAISNRSTRQVVEQKDRPTRIQDNGSNCLR